MKKRKPPVAAHSARLLVRLEASSVGMFRFLLEAWDNLAGFTVLDRDAALLKVFFSPQQEGRIRLALEAINTEIPLTVMPWPIIEPIAAPSPSDQQADDGGQSGPEQSGPTNMTEQGGQAG